MQLHPRPFGESTWLSKYGMFSPMWGRSDEITMSLLGNETGDTDWLEAHTKTFYQSYSRSGDMDEKTRRILDRAERDVDNSGDIYACAMI